MLKPVTVKINDFIYDQVKDKDKDNENDKDNYKEKFDNTIGQNPRREGD